MRIAWESQGAGAPVLLIHGLGYTREGWGPLRERLARRYRVLSFDNRGIGESEIPPGPTRSSELAGDALQVLDEAGVERAHVLGASLGGFAPGGRRRGARARRPARARLHLARRRRRLPAARGDAPADGRGAVARARGGAAPLRRERARAGRARGARRRDLRLPPGAPARPGRLGGAGRRGRRLGSRTAVSGGSRRRRSSSPAPPTRSSTRATRELLAERIPGARLELVEGAGHLLFWEQPEEFAALVEEVPRMSR